jgi:hypothetical protein
MQQQTRKFQHKFIKLGTAAAMAYLPDSDSCFNSPMGGRMHGYLKAALSKVIRPQNKYAHY